MPVQSIHRAFHLLQALAVEPAGLTALARRADLPKSTTARLLATLEELEAVERSEEGTYRVGPTMTSLAGSGGTSGLASVAVPHLQNLTDETGEAAGLSIPDGYRVHYIAQLESDNPVQIRDWTEELIPMHVVASGIVFMAQWPAERLARYFAKKPKAHTRTSIRTEKAFTARAEQLANDGFVWTMEEFVEGLNSVAAPIRNREGQVVAALHVHGPAYRFPAAEGEDEIGSLVVEAATRLSRALKRLG